MALNHMQKSDKCLEMSTLVSKVSKLSILMISRTDTILRDLLTKLTILDKTAKEPAGLRRPN